MWGQVTGEWTAPAMTSQLLLLDHPYAPTRDRMDASSSYGCPNRFLVNIQSRLPSYRGTSPIRNRPTPYHPPRTLGIGLWWFYGGAFSHQRGTSVARHVWCVCMCVREKERDRTTERERELTRGLVTCEVSCSVSSSILAFVTCSFCFNSSSCSSVSCFRGEGLVSSIELKFWYRELSIQLRVWCRV